MNTVPADSGRDIALTDVMLAMDVVDTLRHEQRLAVHALNDEAREQELVERVRRAYAAQGLDVSEAMIVEGVASLKARQYVYEPPPPGLKTALLRGWVKRRSIGGGLLVVVVLSAIIAAGWYGFVERPAQRELVSQAAALNSGIASADDRLRALGVQRTRLADGLAVRVDETPPAPLATAYATLIGTATRNLADADAALRSAATLGQLPSVSADNLADRGGAADQLLTRQQNALNEADNALTAGLDALSTIDGLIELPARLAALRDDAQRLAVEPAVDQRIGTIHDDGIAALRRGDVDAAADAVAALRDLTARLEQDYELRIVSRPGALSGIIREPTNNRRANNYYLIVEALDASGQPVAVDVRSEEDGSTRTVSKWGVRVSEQVFARIRDDKADDGIIQQALIGKKPRGYLELRYDIPVEGGFINRWETP